MTDVFISYSSEDRDRVRPLVTTLERGGWNVWWDRQIDAGVAFDREIERAIDEAMVASAVSFTKKLLICFELTNKFALWRTFDNRNLTTIDKSKLALTRSPNTAHSVTINFFFEFYTWKVVGCDYVQLYDCRNHNAFGWMDIQHN